MYVSKEFSGNGPVTLRTQSFRFLSVETLKTLVYSDTVENEEPIQRSKFYAYQSICNRPGTTVCDSPWSDLPIH